MQYLSYQKNYESDEYDRERGSDKVEETCCLEHVHIQSHSNLFVTPSQEDCGYEVKDPQDEEPYDEEDYPADDPGGNCSRCRRSGSQRADVDER